MLGDTRYTGRSYPLRENLRSTLKIGVTVRYPPCSSARKMQIRTYAILVGPVLYCDTVLYVLLILCAVLVILLCCTDNTAREGVRRNVGSYRCSRAANGVVHVTYP